MTTHTFEAPPGLRFSCTRCGDCCRTWDVLLGPGEEERLGDLDWEVREPELRSTAQVTDAPSALGGGRRLARRPDGSCVFLDPGRGCLIHHHFGEPAKPLLCRMYPFGFMRMGSRVTVDASFACRSVAEGEGAVAGQLTPEWIRLLEDSPPAGAGDGILSPGRAVTPEVLWELEHGMVSILGGADHSFSDRLRAAVRFAELCIPGNPEAPAAGELRSALLESLPRRMASRPPEGNLNAAQRAVFLQETYAHLNPPPPGAADGGRESGDWVRQGEDFREERGKPRINGVEFPVAWSAMRQTSLEGLETAGDDLLGRWFTAAIVGQRFRFAGDEELGLDEAVARLALRLPMALWGARALAAARGAAGAELRDLRDAVRLVDRTAGRVPLRKLDATQRKALRVVLCESGMLDACLHDLGTGRL